ncbi:MAG: hypothetical protein AAB725_02925 [Patescibacteria group bacterium]
MKTLSLLGSFIQIGGFLIVVAWIVFALPLCSFYVGGFGGVGTFHDTSQGLEFVIMHKWHLTSSQFDAYMLLVMFSIVFAKFGSWGVFLGHRIKAKTKE